MKKKIFILNSGCNIFYYTALNSFTTQPQHKPADLK
jgi:hypothetical protein